MGQQRKTAQLFTFLAFKHCWHGWLGDSKFICRTDSEIVVLLSVYLHHFELGLLAGHRREKVT